MKIGFIVNETVENISAEITNMVTKCQNSDNALEKIADVLKDAVHNELMKSRSKNDAPGHVHMSDEIWSNVKESKKGVKYVSTRGGNNTGYKWHIINDGHLSNSFSKGKLKTRSGGLTSKGKGAGWIPGTKFMENSVKNAEPEIMNVIDEYVKGIAE